MTTRRGTSRSSTIASKLIRVNMLVCGVALVLACAAFGLYDRTTVRAAVQRNLSIQAQMAGANSVSALMFDDPRTAEVTLDALQAAPGVISAEIMTPAGETFARYARDGSGPPPATPELAAGEIEARYEDGQQLVLARRIMFQGKDVGTVVVRSDLVELNQRRTQYIFIGATVLATALFAAFLVALVSQRSISAPIVDLEGVARKVSNDKDYSVRAAIASQTREIDVLVDAFNGMLTQIQQRDESLRVAQEQLEARVRERTAELDTVNKELESFSYSVSHDLRAPLRHIAGFAGLLTKRTSQLDDQGRDYLIRIEASAHRMGRLIDDLLDFSRMNRADLSRARVSLNELVRDARQELTADRDGAGRTIDWHVDDLPEIQGDWAMMRQVVTNLLSNAVKYSSSRERARIDVGIQAGESGEVVVFVRDNGVGFDMQYVNKLFGVFQRLHSTEEFEGTGIGLANVRRIIHRHGGRVWAEGTVDRGATFFFSLPAQRR